VCTCRLLAVPAVDRKNGLSRPSPH
jgi:hypothetical protein